MSKTWKAILGVILIFVFGFFSGIVVSSIVVKHKMAEFLKHPMVAISAALEKRLTGNLNLDADQKKQVDAYFKENLQRRRELQMQIQPQVQAANQTTFQEIKAVLRPDQAERFQTNVDALRQRIAKFTSDANSEFLPQPVSPAPSSSSGNPSGH